MNGCSATLNFQRSADILRWTGRDSNPLRRLSKGLLATIAPARLGGAEEGASPRGPSSAPGLSVLVRGLTKENESSWIFEPRLTCSNTLRRVQNPGLSLGRRGDLELRTGDSERGPGRSFHQRVAPGPPCEADPSCTSAPSRPHPSEAAETACQRFARNRLSDGSSWTVTLALPTAGIVWSHHNPLGAPPGC